MRIRNKTNGQVAIIVLLLTALALSFGLSTTRQSVFDTRIESDTQDQRRAFNAAESAIDNYIGSNGANVEYGSSIGTSATITQKDIVGVSKGGAVVLEYPDFVSFGQRSYFWLMGHNSDGSLDPSTYYGSATVGVCSDASFYGGLYIEIVYRDASGPTPIYTVERVANNIRLSGINSGGGNFSSKSTTPCGKDVLSDKFGFDVNLSTNLGTSKLPVMIVVRPLTLDTETPAMRGTKILLKANTGGIFPSQGYELAATGKAGSTQRVLRVENRWVPALGYDFWFDAISGADSIEGN